MIEDTRLRLLAALGHCVEVLDDLKPCGHSGDEETGEHDDDCMLCRVEAALAHAEEEGGVKGGIEPCSPLPLADVPPSPQGSVSGADAVCMPPVSAEPYRGVGRTGDCDCADDFACAEHGGSHALRDHK